MPAWDTYTVTVVTQGYFSNHTTGDVTRVWHLTGFPLALHVPLGYIAAVTGNVGVQSNQRAWTVENTAHLRQPRQLNPDKLIAARLAAGIDTQWQMAELIGMTRGRYNRWEQPNPPTNLPHRIVEPLLTILGVQWTDISDPIP